MIDPKSLHVYVGMPCGPEVPWQTMMSLLAAQKLCYDAGIPLDMGLLAGSSVVTTARSRVLHGFLQSKATRLLWIDSDIVFTPDDFARILQLSYALPVVCGAYPLKNDTGNIVVNLPPANEAEFLEAGCVKIHGTGLGFCAVQREAIERLVAEKPIVRDQVVGDDRRSVFRLDLRRHPDGTLTEQGEDMAFFADLRALGYEIWLDPTLKLGHIGPKVYRGDPIESLGLSHIFKGAA